MKWLALGVALVAVAGPLAPTRAQSAASPRATEPQTVTPADDNTGTIRGQVTRADTGAPIRRATIAVEIPGAALRHAFTDDEGRYVVTGLPRNRYQVSASKSPFVPMKHGQRYPNGPNTVVDLTTTRTANRVDIALWRGGVIAGRVSDDIGEPAAYVQVAALRPRFANGSRKLETTGRVVTTDDLGQYRLAGLPTGSYYVATVPTLERGIRLAPSYYPGTQDVAAAARIAVKAGTESAGADFALLFDPAATVRGMVVGDAGGAVPATVLLTNGFGTTTSAARPDGRFEFMNVAPGEYTLTAMLLEDPGNRRMTSVPVSIEGDLDGIVLTLARGETLRGVVTTDEGVPPSFGPDRIALRLISVPGVQITTGWFGEVVVRKDWTFEIPDVGGAFLVRPRSLPDGWMIDRILAGSDDVTDVGVRVTKGKDVGELRMVLTNQTTELSGSVVDDQNRTVTSCVVVVFADDSSKWISPSRFVATAAPDTRGRFTVQNVPPGTYLAVALDYVEDRDWEDPEVLASLRESAATIDLRGGERKTVSLPLTRRQW